MTESAAVSGGSFMRGALDDPERTGSYRYLRQLFESVPAAIVFLDVYERVADANPEFCRIFGYAVDEMIGRPINDLVVPDQLVGEAVALNRRVLRGERVSLDTVRSRQDGSYVNVAVLGIPIELDGRVVGAYGIYRDITFQKQIEAERDELLAEVRRMHAGVHASDDRRQAILRDVIALLSTPAPAEMLLKRLARAVVPELADSCIVYLRNPDGSVRRLEVAFAEAAQEELLRKQLHHYPPDLSRLIPPVARTLETGEPQLMSEVSIGALKAIPGDAEHVSIALLVGLSSLLVVPLQDGDRVLGALSFGIADSGRRYHPDDLAVAEEIARHASRLLADRLR
jgi:PAS domain S-box-containing protein